MSESFDALEVEWPGADRHHGAFRDLAGQRTVRGDEHQGGAPLGLAGVQGVLAAAKDGLCRLGGLDKCRLTERLSQRCSLDLIAHVLADGDLGSFDEAGVQRDVIDGDGRGTAGAVGCDGCSGPERRLGHDCPRESQLGGLSVEDHPERIPARYGATRLRTYFASMSSSRLTLSPTRAVPSVVRRSVSGMSAAPNVGTSPSGEDIR